MTKRIYYLLWGTLLFAQLGLAQQHTHISGRIIDDQGGGVKGATIQTGSSGHATQSASDGTFSLEVLQGEEISASLVGYETRTIVYEGQSPLLIQLSPEQRSLDEVVVVGYGTQRRRDLVGAVEQIGGEQLQNRGNMNISRSLQGAMPGLNISMRDGKPSRGATLNLRGTGSIGAGGGALILIDGVEGDMTTVNPDDVESVSI